jgi:hypothetical protein
MSGSGLANAESSIEWIKKEFANLSREQCMEILNVLLENKVEYTKNENGVFFSWQELNENVRGVILKTINFGKIQREKIEEIEKRIDEVRDINRLVSNY